VDIVETIVQVLLGVVFVAAGTMHLRLVRGATPSPQMAWIKAVPPSGMTAIAVLEVVGGAVLAVAAFTGPAWLAGLAAVCFVALMFAAVIFHLRRTGEAQNAAFNVILGVVAAIVAYANLA
jgi:uncharacterized membrane protein YphA (DoxX/SURF4 family)